MYAWIWRKLPFGRCRASSIGSLLLIAAGRARCSGTWSSRGPSRCCRSTTCRSAPDGGVPGGEPTPTRAPGDDPGDEHDLPVQHRDRTTPPLRTAEQVSPMRILVIDNYDSFVFNLVQYLGQLGVGVRGAAQRRDRRGRRRPARRRRGPALPRPGYARTRRHLHGRDHASTRASCRSSASASATRRSARRSAPPSPARPELLHGKTSEVHHKGDGRAGRAARPVHRDPLPLAGRAAARPCRTRSR